MLSIQKNLSGSFYALLSLPSTALGFALSVQISALSWILSTKYGLAIHDVGLVWAAGPIAGIIGQVLIGLISDNVWFWKGRRRPFILIGGVLAALMLLALPNIGIISSSLGLDGILGVAIAVALTLDLSINVGFNPTRSIIADVTPEGNERTKGYTWMQTISGTFGVMAYFIGAVWGNELLIYIGAVIVFILCVFPPLFIEEPRELKKAEDETGKNVSFSFLDIIKTIEPLWGFLIYSVYGITLRLAHITVDNYYFEYFCLILSILLIAKSLFKSEEGKSREEAGEIGFKKVLAAHSFTWIGVQTMFVYMFAYVMHEIYGLAEGSQISEAVNKEMGQVVSISFLILNAVGAILPAFVLEPLARKIGRVRVHTLCIAVMAGGYAGIAFFGTSNIIVYVMMAVLGIGWAATVSLPFAIMSQKVDQAKMGLYMGLFNLSVVLPQLVASLGVGQAVSKSQDKSLIFVIAAVTLVISAFGWFMVKEEKNSNAEIKPGGGGGH